MLKIKKDKILLFLKATIALIILFFIAKYIKSNSNSLKEFKFQINYYYLIISSIILILYIFNQFVLWYYITKLNKCNLSFSTSIISRAYSEFGKYVPGKVFGYAMLLYVYSKENKSKVQLTFSMFFELLSSVLAAALIFLFSIFFTDIHEFQKYRLVSLILLVVFFIVIHPKILNYFSAIFFRITKREPVNLSLSYLQIIKLISLYVVNFMLFGVAFVLFIKSIYSISFSDYLFITCTTAAAGLIGLFAIFVPAGLGVREGVLVFTLSFIMPPALAGIIALTSRLWLTFAEVFLFGLIFGFSKLKPNKIFVPYKDNPE